MSSVISPEIDECKLLWAFEYGDTSGRGGSLGETLGGGGALGISTYSGAGLIGLFGTSVSLNFWLLPFSSKMLERGASG